MPHVTMQSLVNAHKSLQDVSMAKAQMIVFELVMGVCNIFVYMYSTNVDAWAKEIASFCFLLTTQHVHRPIFLDSTVSVQI